jgi:hypothetical protein
VCKSCLCAVVSRSAATVQMVCSGGWQRKTSHVLRDAHAYMLISIPTATSTIFGAFQAMFSSFQVGRRHVCFSTIARFGWWTHLSTRIRRRNCDQGSRPDRRLRRAAEPTSFTVKSISRQHASPGRFSERPLVEQDPCDGPQSSTAQGDS